MPKAKKRGLVAGGQSRRVFLAGVAASGFALAVRPVSAQTIVTDTRGLIAGPVELPTGDRPIPAYHALPETGGPFPVVIVVQEIFGVHEHIRDVCRRLAKSGYFAVAPELFVRQGDVSGMADIQRILKDVVSQVPDAQVMSDLDDTLGWCRSHGRADVASVGITGFCWGGRIVWLYAAHNPDVKAGVAWYGRLTGSTDELRPKQPVDVAAALTVPVLGLYGGADAGIPLEAVEKMRKELGRWKSRSEIIVYPGAPHAFFADYRPSFRKAEAADGWKRLLGWFRAHGVEAPLMSLGPLPGPVVAAGRRP
jgi:carboxymethylenebutenolidase